MKSKMAIKIVLFVSLFVTLFTNIALTQLSLVQLALAQPAQGDWIITGEEVVENEVITLNGNLIVKNGGRLTLRNVTLTIDNSYTGQYGISAEPGSSIFIYDSILSPSNLEYKFSFEVEDAVFVMMNSKLRGAGYLTPHTRDALLIRHCQNAIIENNLMEHINSIAISLHNVRNSVIRNNNVTAQEEANDPDQWGFDMLDCENNTIANNYITGFFSAMVIGKSHGNYFDNNELLPGTAGHLGQGITLLSSNNNVFVNNKIHGPTGCTPFRLLTSKNNRIENNSMWDMRFGVVIACASSNNIVVNNNISGIYEYDAVLIYRSQKNFVINNDISSAVRGITLSNFARNNIIQANTISAIEQEGISLYFSSDSNTITENKVSDNKKGILVHESSKNTIYNNNFIENSQQGYDDKSNSWSFEGIGNYWSDYEGEDGDGDGIGDTSYYISLKGMDERPLMESRSVVPATVPAWEPLMFEKRYEPPHKDITDEVRIENQVMLLENSFTIKNGGKLIFENVILSSPETVTDEPYHITVDAGGSLYIYNSKITAPETGKSSIYISALDGSTLILKNSELHHVDGGMGNPGPSGAAITILGADITIENNIINDSRVGISLGWTACSGSIANNTYSNVLFPIEGEAPGSNLRIEGNVIHDADILPLQYVSEASWSPWPGRKAPESVGKEGQIISPVAMLAKDFGPIVIILIVAAILLTVGILLYKKRRSKHR